MRKNYLLLALIIFMASCSMNRNLVVVPDNTQVGDSNALEEIAALEEAFSHLEGVTFERISTDSDHFVVGYKVMVRQLLDHSDPSRGSFMQKFYLNHSSFKAPMVMNLNGYSVPNNGFTSELVPWLKSNFIHVEHRFFGESIPTDRDYTFLTIEQAAGDHHHIIEILKKVYPGKWVTTGISKGGQATIFHSRYFPEDADVSIPYVAPVNLAAEDPRLITFLDQVGTSECRTNILTYQRELLSDYGNALQEFKKQSGEKDYSYPMNLEKAFELSVLEFEFAYWQWQGGNNCDEIPGKGDSVSDLISYLFNIDAPGFFTKAGIEYFFPFFYQAYAELGMYGYSVDSLQGYLKEYDTYVSNYYTFIPEGMTVTYNPNPLQEVYQYLENDADNFIYVYGENDAWSATAFVANPVNTNSMTFFKKDGSHFTRINDLSEEQKAMVFAKLQHWLEMDLFLGN